MEGGDRAMTNDVRQVVDIRAIARGVIERVIRGHGDEVFLGEGYNADETLFNAIVAALSESRERAEKAEADVKRLAAGLETARHARDLNETRAREAEGLIDRLRGEMRMHVQQRITTRCPSCGHQSLFIGSGGHLTCSWLECKEPGLERAISKLTAQPAPSGGQPIAAMNPWANGRCMFCSVAQFPTFPQRLSDLPHADTCLWQNAVDAGQHAKDAIPPASPADWQAEERALEHVEQVISEEPLSTETHIRAAMKRVAIRVLGALPPEPDASEPPTKSVGWINSVGPLAVAPSAPAPEASPAKETK